MPCDASSLSIMDLHRSFLAHLRPLDVDKVHIMSCRVNDCPEEKLIGDLTMKLGLSADPMAKRTD
jgi:hypothetical protein